VPPTNIGGFDASYDPQSQVLLIEVRTGVNFINGLAIDASNVITANHTDLAQAVTDGMTLPPGDRAAFVDQFAWGLLDKLAFLLKLQDRVESAWSGQYFFSCTRPGWESIFASVAVDVDVHFGDAGADDHLQTNTYKVPEGGTYSVGAFVDSNPTSTTTSRDDDPHNNLLVMSSTDVDETPLDQSLLRRQVLFDHDSAVLTPDAQTTLRGFERDFQDANLDLTNPVALEGHASASGSEEHNERLAQKRIEAVRNFLAGLGFTGINERVSTQNFGEEGAIEDPAWRRVDLIVDSGEGQLVASHEFGHVFGLDDEYVGGTDAAGNPVNPGGTISGSGSAVGTAVDHDALAKAIGTSGAIAENNDDIMSLGNTVQPKHYATFGWALAQVTGIDEWQVV
jgi:outer membrane protein OmpA-like peptidoglycan-associated protein